MFQSILSYDMDVHYLNFLERNLANMENLMSVWIMNSVGLDSENSVINVSIFNDYADINNSLKELYWDEQCFMQIFGARVQNLGAQWCYDVWSVIYIKFKKSNLVLNPYYKSTSLEALNPKRPNDHIWFVSHLGKLVGGWRFSSEAIGQNLEVRYVGVIQFVFMLSNFFQLDLHIKTRVGLARLQWKHQHKLDWKCIL